MTARVLIVEDEALVAMDLRESLEDMGYKVVGVAADSARAFEMAAMEPDLALVDLNLRDGLTGPEIGKRLAREHDSA
jgi:two-component system, response regulator PdtaR